MISRLVVPAIFASLLIIPAANAASTLIAIGTLSGSIGDLSSQTAGLLENGQPGNLLGGVGSAFAWAGGNTFIALPDRGPNAVTYNAGIADTTSYIDRFQTINFNLQPIPSGGLPFTVTPTLTATTLLSSSTPLIYGTGAFGTPAVAPGAPALNVTNNTFYFTGRSDGFDSSLPPSTNPSNARLDPEGARVSSDGKSVFVTDEYGPYVYQFDRATGQRIKSFALPGNLAVANQGPTTASEGLPAGSAPFPGNTTGRVGNKGMEGLAITPDGKTLVGIMQAPLLQDDAKQIRIVTIDIATGTTREFGYRLTTGSGVSEITAINDHEFLVDERDGNGLGAGNTASVKSLFKIDLNGAVDISGVANMTSSTPAVTKTLFLDVRAALNNFGIPNDQIPSKIEGLAFGPDLSDGRHTLWVTNDNDFDPTHSGDNKYYVFAVDAADLPTYQSQVLPQSVPEPETYATLLASLGLIGFVAQRRKPRAA